MGMDHLRGRQAISAGSSAVGIPASLSLISVCTEYRECMEPIQIHLKRKGNFCEQTLIQIHFKQVYFFVTLVIDN